MPQLRVDLQDGFAGDSTVIFKIAGKEVRRSKPKTRTQIGLAEANVFDVPKSKQRTILHIELPDKGISGSYEFVPSGDLSVGVSLEPTNVLSFRISAEPFGYV